MLNNNGQLVGGTTSCPQHQQPVTEAVMSKGIYHKHHIVPRHMGGTDDPSNLIELTIEEHAEAHRLLWEQHGKLEDKLAWKMLAGLTEEGEKLRIELHQTPEFRAKMSKIRKGKPLSVEHRKKLSMAKLGKRLPPFTEEHKAKIGAAKRGQCHSDQTKARISEAKMGQLHTQETKEQIAETMRMHVRTEEHKKNISAALKGKVRHYREDGSFYYDHSSENI